MARPENPHMEHARLAQAIYRHPPHRKFMDLGWNVRRYRQLRSSGIDFAMVVNTDSELCVVIRGTQIHSWIDVIRNLMAHKEPAPFGGRAHAGYLAAALVLESMLPRIVDLVAQYRTVTLAGHSAAGAIALLLGCLWGRRIRVISFGAPHSLDRNGAAAAAALVDHRRVAARGDPIHRILWILGYRHDSPSIPVGKGSDLALDHPIERYMV